MRKHPSLCEESALSRIAPADPVQLPPGGTDATPRPTAGVIFQSPAYGTASAAEEGRAQALALARCGVPVRLVPTDSPDDSEAVLPAEVHQDLERLTHPKLDLARSILYHASPPLTWQLDYYGRYRVGRAMFWTDRIPESWVESCNAMDEVWVPSEFNRGTFAASGVAANKLRVVPPGVDTKLFRPGLPPLEIPHRRSFNFLCVTNLHDRKGTELLLQAFLGEFKADEDVALVLKASPKKESPVDLLAELVFFIEKQVGLPLENSPAVICLEDSLTPSEMASLYAASDAFVLPTHGESYGRAVLEAIASELPVITTRWGGPLDFLDDETSYLIDIEGVLAAPPDEAFVSGHFWANPSRDHLRQLMRGLYSDPEGARERARKGRKRITENWDLGVVVAQWRREFQRLLGECAEDRAELHWNQATTR